MPIDSNHHDATARALSRRLVYHNRLNNGSQRRHQQAAGGLITEATEHLSLARQDICAASAERCCYSLYRSRELTPIASLPARTYMYICACELSVTEERARAGMGSDGARGAASSKYNEYIGEEIVYIVWDRRGIRIL